MKLSVSALVPSVEGRSSDSGDDERGREGGRGKIRHRVTDNGNSLIY